jgi:RNA polymerase sigma-70 factor (ECF subfamily)
MYMRSAWQRKATLFRDLPDDLHASIVPTSPASPVQLRLDLERALTRLPDTSRIVVMLHDVEGYTHREIAELMGMSVSFSKSQLARAHRRLRAILASHGEHALERYEHTS